MSLHACDNIFSLLSVLGIDCQDIVKRGQSLVKRSVLVGPGWRKPFKRIPGLLSHDVIQWRMDHVLHY